MARHRREAGIRAVGWVAAAAVTGAVVAGGWWLVREQDTGQSTADRPAAGSTAAGDAQTSAPDDAAQTSAPGHAGATAPDAATVDCADQSSTVTVWVAEAVEPVVTEVADELGGCTAYEVSTVPSAEVRRRIAAGEAPDVWIPDGTLWSDLAGDGVTPGPVLASTPVVLAGPEDFVRQVSAQTTEDDGTTGWAEVLTLPGQPLQLAAPTQDPASLAGLVTVSARLEAGSSTSRREAVLVTLAQRALEEAPADVVRAGTEVLVPLTAQQAGELQSAGVATLVPAGGAGSVSFPWVETGPGAEAADELARALRSADAAGAWRSAGLRPGAPDERDVSLDPARAGALLEAWDRVSAPSRMLVLIDVSGSMDAVVGPDGRTRFDLTMDAAAHALPALPPRSQVGLWWFSTDRGPDGEDWVEELPLASMDERRGGASHRERLMQLATGLDDDHTTGDTGLHDSLYAAYRHLQADHDPAYRNSVVVLTDGINDDPGGGLTQSQLVARLQDAEDTARPVDVIVIGMGPQMRARPMQEITDAVGGTFRQLDEATQIQDVLTSIIANRPTR
jgi:hypothetical protein